MVMIDWVTAKLPLHVFQGINSGKLVRLDSEGGVEWSSDSRLAVEGSFSNKITIRKVEGIPELELSGNPAKFQQGHNLFGSCDLSYLVTSTVCAILNKLNIKIPKHDLASWLSGDFTVSRLDINDMISLQSRAEVRSVIRALSECASMKYRGRGVFKHSTLYFGKQADGKQASAWSLKLYCKADELNVHELPDDFTVCLDSYVNKRLMPSSTLPSSFAPFRKAKLLEWIDNKLRIELQLNRKELFKFGLQKASSWSASYCETVFRSYLERLEIGETVCVSVEEEKSLPRALRRTFSDWKEGKDMRQVLPKPTFYRHRAELKKLLDVDISVLQPKSAQIIPLRKTIVLDFTPAPIPTEFLTPAYLVQKHPYWDFAIDAARAA